MPLLVFTVANGIRVAAGEVTFPARVIQFCAVRQRSYDVMRKERRDGVATASAVRGAFA